MKNFDTTFIIKLYGISAERGQPALIFLEYMEKVSVASVLHIFSFSSSFFSFLFIIIAFSILIVTAFSKCYKISFFERNSWISQ